MACRAHGQCALAVPHDEIDDVKSAQARKQASGGKIPDFPLDRYHFVEKQMEYGLQGNNAIAV